MSAKPAACRLILDPPGAGAWNMAVDEALLGAADETTTPTLRFYEWSKPTLSLGYFQRVEDRRRHAASATCPLVRRSTGGGAILHHRELTYSLVWPAADRFSARAQSLYDTIHESLIGCLVARGIPAEINGHLGTADQGEQSFLCFQRRVAGDVLIHRDKIAGSAQRRLRGTVLQHGSVLLERSPQAPELPGIKELTGVYLDPAELAAILARALADRLAVTLEPSTLTELELRVARQVDQGKFRENSWTNKR
jgi:lipoate-protein ligase A